MKSKDEIIIPNHTINKNQNNFSEIQRILFFECFATMILSYGVQAHLGEPFKLALFFILGAGFAGPFTGGHMNPAITFCFYLRQNGGIN